MSCLRCGARPRGVLLVRDRVTPDPDPNPLTLTLPLSLTQTTPKLNLKLTRGVSMRA